jgi:hypothetical protein
VLDFRIRYALASNVVLAVPRQRFHGILHRSAITSDQRRHRSDREEQD